MTRRDVERDRHVGPIRQALAGQARQHAAGANFQEHAAALRVERVDAFAEAHRLGELACQLRLDGLGLVGIRLRGAVGDHRQARRRHGGRAHVGGERRGSRSHQRRVERRRNLQRLEAEPRRGQRLFDLRQALDRTAQHGLLRVIVVREHQVRVAVPVHDRAHRRGVSGDRQHAAQASGVGAPFDPQASMARPRARARRTSVSASKTPAAWSATSSPKLWPAAAAGRTPSRSSNASCARLAAASAGCAALVARSRASWRLQRLGLEGRARKHDLAEVIGAVRGRHALTARCHASNASGKVDGEIAAHPDVLAALAGEQERHRVGGRGRADAARRSAPERAWASEPFSRSAASAQTAASCAEVRHDERDADGRIGREAGLRLAGERRELRGGAEPSPAGRRFRCGARPHRCPRRAAAAPTRRPGAAPSPSPCTPPSSRGSCCRRSRSC